LRPRVHALTAWSASLILYVIPSHTVRKAVDAIVHDPENANQHILLVGHGASVHAALLALNPKAKHKAAYYCRYATA